MKRQLRRLGIGSIICCALLFIACEPESIKEPEPNNAMRVVIKTLSLEELENRFQVIEKLETILPGFRTAIPFDGRYNFTLNTDEIVYIEKGNQHSYTFSIIRKDYVPGLENLVLNYEQGDYTAYEIRYDFTAAQLAHLDNLESQEVQVSITPFDPESSIADKKSPEPCVIWEKREVAWNEQGVATHSEWRKVIDQDCMDQLNSGGQTSGSTTSGGISSGSTSNGSTSNGGTPSGGVPNGGWGGWQGTGVNTGVYDPPSAGNQGNNVGENPVGHTGSTGHTTTVPNSPFPKADDSSSTTEAGSVTVFTKPVFNLRFALYLKKFKESMKTVVPNSLWWRTTNGKKISEYLKQHFDNQTGLIDIKASEFIVSCIQYLAKNNFSNESQSFIISLIEQVTINFENSNKEQWSEDIILFSIVKNVIDDIEEYLACFKTNQSAVFTLYVDQPLANNNDSWSGSMTNPDVGHTFISIKQGNIRRVLGFYPEQGVNPFTNPSTSSVLIDDSGHTFDVSISTPINPVQLQHIISYIKNFPKIYNLNTYNCTDFGMYMSSLSGISIPSALGSWPGGSGDNPGQLGQNIRGMVIPTNMQRNTTGGTSLSNLGNCN